MSQPNIIIIGAPRSGTYWMVDILQRRFAVAVPSETHFIPIFRKHLWLYGNLVKPQNRRRLLHDIFRFIEIWTYNSSDAVEYRAAIRSNSLLCVFDAGLVEDIILATSDYDSVVDGLFAAFGKMKDRNVTGDKSAHYRAQPVLDTLKGHADVKAIHVVRDGRDVAASWLSQWFGPSKIGDAAKLWREHVRAYQAWGQAHPDQYLQIRYEDMAADMAPILTQLSKFLGLNITEEAEPTEIAKALAHTKSHAGMVKMQAVTNIRKWESMAVDQRTEFEHIAAPELRDFDYFVETVETPEAVSAFTSKLNPFHKHQILVSVKGRLPLILRVANMLHFPVHKLAMRNANAPWGRKSPI